MKRIVTSMFMFSLVLAGAIVGNAAGKAQVTAELAAQVNISADGRNIDLSKNNPLLYKGAVYVPASALAQALGYQSAWESSTNTLSLSIPDNHPLTKKNGVEVAAVTMSPVVWSDGRAYYAGEIAVNITEPQKTGTTATIEILNSQKKVVSSQLITINDKQPGTYKKKIETYAFPLPFKIQSEGDGVNKAAAMYTYRVKLN